MTLRRIQLVALFLLSLDLHGASDPKVSAAQGYLQHGDFRKALDSLQEIIRTDPKRDPEIYVMAAVARLNLDDKTGALQTCEQGLLLFPSSDRIADFYVTLLPDAVPPAENQKRLEAALAQNPDSAYLRKGLARVMLDARSEDPRLEQLLAGARKGLARDPEVYFLYGRWACYHQKEAVCVEALRKSLALSSPDNYAAIVLSNGMIGVAEDRLAQHAEARAAFERSLAGYRKLEPPVPDVPYQYVRFLLAQSDDKTARTVNAEILRRNPAFAPSHLEQAKFLFRDGQIAEAADEANLALKHSSADKVQLRAIHSFLVKAYSALDREQDAKIHQEWVDANP